VEDDKTLFAPLPMTAVTASLPIHPAVDTQPHNKHESLENIFYFKNMQFFSTP